MYEKATASGQQVHFPPIPTATARETESVYGRDHSYIRIGQNLDLLLDGMDQQELDCLQANKAEAFHIYSLMTIFQYWEGLTNRQMATAVRVRTDLKYAMHLPSTFPGLDPRVLCSFRQRLLNNPLEMQVFGKILDHLNKSTDQKNRPQDAVQLIYSVCQMERVEAILDQMENALGAVAAKCPKWLLANALPHWFERYQRKPGTRPVPQKPDEMEVFVDSIGKDGEHLLETIHEIHPVPCAELPEIKQLGREWGRQLDNENGVIKLRCIDCQTCTRGIAS